MPRRNLNNDHNHRGRGGRGSGRGRGAYRGSNTRGRAYEEYPHASHELDYVVQRYPQGEFGIPDSPRGSESTTRSRSGGKIPQRGTDSPLRGNGHGTPRGRGQSFGLGNGRGRGNAQYRARGWSLGMSQRGRGIETKQLPNRDAPLSDLLYFERPLLRPIKFVRAAHTPFLFRESEEIFQPPLTSNDTAVQSNVPTAERVACIFNNTQPCLRADTISEGETSDELEEIDFADLGTFRARFDGVEHMAQKKMKLHPGNAVNEETFTGTYNEEQLQELSQAQEADHGTTTWEEKSTAVAANDTTLRTLEQSVETLQMRDNHDVRAFPDDRSPRTPSKSAAIESTLSKSNNACANMKPEDNLSIDNTASKPRDVFETAATAGTESNGGDHGYFIDTQPSQPFTSHSASDVNPTDGSGRGEILGEEEEIIVYVAPYPRPGRIQPTHDTTPRVELPTCSILTGTSETRSASREQKGVSIIESPVPSNPQLSLHSMSLDFQRAEPSTQPRYPTAFTPSQKRKANFI
ncbi:hypothetical protein EDC04DRAFT_2121057 [Pisolithus marmoratus]|nr:hypothetical protein EDC04DRAFT_2121057 [Pisolithus marmoratus]